MTDLQIMIPAEEVEKIKNHFGVTHEKLELILKQAITQELETSDGYTNYNYGDDGNWPRFNLPYSTNDPYQQETHDTFRRGQEAWAKLSREEKDEWKTKWKNSGRPKGQRMRISDLLNAEEGPSRKWLRREKRRRLKAMSPTLTVTKVESSNQPTLNTITFDNGIKAPHAKSKNAKVGDKFVVASQDGRFAHILDAEEGNAPIQDPMELGEMANWTPLDGSEGLKRKRAETFEADFDYYYSSSDKARGMEILDRLRTMNPETKSKALDWLIDNGYLHSEEVYDSAYINAMGDALYITSEEDDYDAETGISEVIWVLKEQNRHGTEVTLHRTKQDFTPFLEEYDGYVEALAESSWGWSGYFGNDSFYISCTQQIVKDAESFSAESPSATIPVNYPTHLRPDWQKTPASDKQIAREMRQAIETGNNADMMVMQDKYGDYWNDKGFKKAFKKEMEGSEPSWVKPVATALGFTLGFLGIHEIKKVL